MGRRQRASQRVRGREDARMEREMAARMCMGTGEQVVAKLGLEGQVRGRDRWAMRLLRLDCTPALLPFVLLLCFVHACSSLFWFGLWRCWV